MGCSVACHLMADGFDGSVAVFEKDPTYEFATTPRSAGGARPQFSTEVNIRVGLYGIRAFERFDEEMAVDGESAHAEFRQRGYLFLADETNRESLERQQRLQASLGADVEMLSSDDVVKMLPHMNMEGLNGGSWSRSAGYTDPYGVLQGYRRKAKSLGAEFIHGKVARIVREGDRVTGLVTENGEKYDGAVLVITAGAWAAEVGASAGLEIPVDPVPRMAYCFDPAEKFDYDLPLVIAPDDLYFRHESGKHILTGKARPEKPGYRFDWDRDYFYNELWPGLAQLVPSFESLKLLRGWAGLYAVCRLDENALIGVYPGVEGLYLAAGFSGHGLQQSPAVGKGLSELIRLGRYETIDLSPLGADRIVSDRRIFEEGIV